MLVTITCYLGLAFVIQMLRPVPIRYNNTETVAVKFSRFAARPILDLGYYRRLSTTFDWQEVSLDDFQVNLNQGLFLKKGSGIEQRFQNWNTVDWVSLNLAQPQESIILQPLNPEFAGEWSLTRCFISNNLPSCQQSNLIFKSTVKTYIYRSEVLFLGIDPKGSLVPLKLVDTIKTSQRTDIPFI